MVNIDEFTSAWALDWTELVEVLKGWVNRKTTTQEIANKAVIPSSQVTDFDVLVDNKIVDAIDVPNDTAKTTPVDADVFTLWDSVDTFLRKKVTRENIKATLMTYFDMVYLWITDLRQWLTANKILITDWSGNETYADLPWWLAKLAWESITEGQPLRLGFTASAQTITQSQRDSEVRFQYSATETASWQGITTSVEGILTNISLSLRKYWTPTGNITVSIHNSTPWTTIAVSSTTINISALTTSFDNYNFAFNCLLPAWVYYIRIWTDWTLSTTNYWAWWGRNSNLYAWGVPYRISNAESRSAPFGSFDLTFSVTISGNSEVITKLYKAKADIWFSNVVGFARNSAALDNNVEIDMVYNTKQSWLTKNTTYYLSNTAGAISTTPWTVSKVVWKSISTTELLIDLFW